MKIRELMKINKNSIGMMKVMSSQIMNGDLGISSSSNKFGLMLPGD